MDFASLLTLILRSSVLVGALALTGCAKQIQDFVDRARVEDPLPVRKVEKDEAATKISPARIDAAGSRMRMEANFTVTNRELKGTSLRAKITTSRTGVEVH